VNPLEAAIHKAIWDVDLSAAPVWKASGIKAARVIHGLVRDIFEGQLSLRAMSLVYTTLLSFVPLLAVSFSVLKGFGVHNQIEPLLLKFLAPLGDKATEITTRIIGFVDNMQVGVLGSVGVGLLIYTVISLIQKIERAFNSIWHTTQTRPIGQRFSNYLSVILVGPLLMFTAVGLTATVMSNAFVQAVMAIEPFGSAISLLTQLVPYLLVIGAFAFVYVFMPNARVRPQSALIGAIVSGIMWEASGWIFASFVASSARYTAIYSGFAILIMFMIWIYLSWLILLLGASLSFYHQHPEYLAVGPHVLRLSSRLKEKMALVIVFLVARDYYRGQPPWTMERLAQRLGIPADATSLVLEALERQEVLVRTSDDPPAYLPRRAPDAVRLKQVIDAVRSAEEGPYLNTSRVSSEAPVEQMLQRIDGAVAAALEDATLKELAALAEAGPRAD
jgi:membrane protein